MMMSEILLLIKMAAKSLFGTNSFALNVLSPSLLNPCSSSFTSSLYHFFEPDSPESLFDARH